MHTTVDGAEFWISWQWLNYWQLIQNLAPSTILWCQCYIRVGYGYHKTDSFFLGSLVFLNGSVHEKHLPNSSELKSIKISQNFIPESIFYSILKAFYTRSGLYQKRTKSTEFYMTLKNHQHPPYPWYSSSHDYTISESTNFVHNNFFVLVFLQSRSFLLRSKMPIQLFKGQWITECLFDFFNFPQKPTKNLTNFCPRI